MFYFNLYLKFSVDVYTYTSEILRFLCAININTPSIWQVIHYLRLFCSKISDSYVHVQMAAVAHTNFKIRGYIYLNYFYFWRLFLLFFIIQLLQCLNFLNKAVGYVTAICNVPNWNIQLDNVYSLVLVQITSSSSQML